MLGTNMLGTKVGDEHERPGCSPLLQPLVPSSWARLGPDAVGEPPPQPIPILGATPLKSWGPT